MKTKSMKAASLVLACSLSAGLIACGGTEIDNTDTRLPDVSDTTSSAETQDMSRVLELPDMDWGGREFRVLSYEDMQYSQFSNFEITSESENGEVLNDAIFRRNSDISDKYNVKIVESRLRGEEFWTTTLPQLRKNTLAYDDLYDLAFIDLGSSGTAAREGLLCDLNEVDYIDFSKEWWNQSVNDTLEISGKLYFTTSDFSLRDKNRVYLLAYNKNMCDELSLGNPVELVRSGEWTIDVMGRWAKSAAIDLNGNGEIEYTDQFGLGTDSTNAFVALLYGCGVQAVTMDKDGKPTLSLNNEHTINAIDKLMNVYGQKDITLECEDYRGKTGNIDYTEISGLAFYEGRELFVTSFPASLKNFSAKCVDEYAILPFPKYDENQEKYCSYADIFGMTFGIPITCADTDFAGFMLEALSAASTDTTLTAYYEISCKTKYTYDPDSAEMLDLIFDNIQYDLSRIYNISGVTDILKNIAYKKENTFATAYASIEQKAVNDIEKLIDDMVQ